MSNLPPAAEMYRACESRDPKYDGLFFLAVKTTGIFCRPTCPARTPLRKNVEFYASRKDALSAGYRPCKRCRPMHVDDLPDWASDLLDSISNAPSQRITESDLRNLGVDPGTVRRLFKKRFGMTFHAYARARRMSNALTEIRKGVSVEHAALDVGYASPSGFRDAFMKSFGAPPSESRHEDRIYFHWMRSPLGPFVAAATDQGICMLEFTDRRMLETQLRTLRRLYPMPAVPGANSHLRDLEEQLDSYFKQQLTSFDVELDLRGSDFQLKVWHRLLQIPYGETMNYESLADSIDCPGGQRSVGRVNGQNRIAIVVPCHRVIGKNGQLTGYGGGLYRKRYLLDLETNCDRVESSSHESLRRPE